jgi:hypothetical protein
MSPDRISRELSEKYDDTVVEISLEGRTLNSDELYEYRKSNSYMITAVNSFSRLLSAIENENRNQLLYNLWFPEHSEILSAIGRSPDRRWVEKGLVVRSSNQSEMAALAKRFEQNAIFRFSSSGDAATDYLL